MVSKFSLLKTVGLLVVLVCGMILALPSCSHGIRTEETLEEIQPLPIPTKPIVSPPPLHEVRAVWMSRFDYADHFKTRNPDSIKSYISTTFHKLKDANFNTVFFQVRGNGDAFYHSRLEPWSAFLSDTLGKDPGWDPLQYAIDCAHQRGLELHAWINTFPIWRGTENPTPSDPPHPYLLHPDWLVCDSAGVPMPSSDHYVSISPGIPAAQDYIVEVVSDIVTNYNVDGIHFDYIRYPENAPAMGFSHDSVSVARFRDPQENPLQLDWANWQRQQLTHFAAKVYNRITNLKPWVKVSAAVIGSYNQPGWNGYHSVYQDARRWMELGKMDMILPMSYYGRQQKGHEFPKVIEDWKEYTEINSRQIIAGIGAYKIPDSEILEEIADTRVLSLPGFVIFAVSSLNDSLLAEMKNGVLHRPALLPPLPWKDAVLPLPPTDLTGERRNALIELRWTAPPVPPDEDVVREYAIYHSTRVPMDFDSPDRLIAIVPGTRTAYAVTGLPKELDHYFSVTAIDDAENQSIPSPIIKVEKNSHTTPPISQEK